MTGYQQETAFHGVTANELSHGSIAATRGHPADRIYDGVSGEVNGFGGDSFAAELTNGVASRGEMPGGEGAEHFAVHLFRERGVAVAGAQPGLDVAHRHLMVVSAQSAKES